MKLYPFFTGLSHLQDFHGIEMNEDEYENIAFHAYFKIGNKRTRMYKVSGHTEDKKFVLPCNVELIEMVTENNEDFQQRSNLYINDYKGALIESQIEGTLNNYNPLYMSGKMLNYEELDGVLYFKQDTPVNILYKGEMLDDEGLPMITGREMEAIANYCAYTYLYKKALATKDQATFQLAQMLKVEWNRTCSNARAPEYLSQNDVNEILNANHSWDRKRYNVSLKLFRK